MDQPRSELADAAAAKAIDEITKTEQPIHLKKPPLMEGRFADVMRKMYKENQKKIRDLNVKENFKFCRKKCPFFKTRSCFKKTFQEQKECYDSRGYEKPEETSAAQTENQADSAGQA